MFGHYDQPPEAYKLTQVAPGLYVTNFVHHSDEKIREIAEREWFKPSPSVFSKLSSKGVRSNAQQNA